MKNIEQIIEALLFASPEPLTQKKINNIFDADPPQLEKYIKTNSSNKKNYKIENKIISDACEAIIGAIFLDQGIKVVERFILDLWHEHINNTTQTKVDSKTRLQEFSLKKFKKLPIYKLIEPLSSPGQEVPGKANKSKST